MKSPRGNKDYYQVLGLNSSATKDEIRRAYRILARRYHPDVNPGRDSSDKFKLIAEAYRVLNDSEQRRKFDQEFENAQAARSASRMKAYTESARANFQAQSRAFLREQEAKERAENRAQKSPKAASKESNAQGRSPFVEKISKHIHGALKKPLSFPWKKKAQGHRVQEISLIEVSVLVSEAILGMRKTVEVIDGESIRKISVRIPPGVRNGSVVRMRNKQSPGQELVLIIQVAHHTYISIEKRGIVVELPVTPEEALVGASIKVPTLEGPLMLKVPPGSQSGTYIRLRGKGVHYPKGDRGDLFYRVLIRIPEASSREGVVEAARFLSEGWNNSVRSDLPDKLLGNASQ